jgi:tRNA threonylcarbamoyladenosine biosynthesis protein TsaE
MAGELSLPLSLPDEASTLRLGAACVSGAAPGRVIHLRGELGAGKTTLVRGLLQALGHKGKVKSPTYTLVEPYEDLRLNVYHFDFYRFKNRDEWLSSGFRDYFNPQSLCIVEWPERAGDLLAPPDLLIHLQYQGEARNATLTAQSPAGESWRASILSRWSAS